jgi:hypothetical protein
MNVTITNDKVISILNSLSTQLDLSIEDVVKLCVAYMDVDTVLSLGHKLSAELKSTE